MRRLITNFSGLMGCLVFVAAFTFAGPLPGTAGAEEPQADARFTVNDDGTVTDSMKRRMLESGYSEGKLFDLMWQQGDNPKMRWTDAVANCEDVKLAGHTNWRLPSRVELLSLANERQRTRPKINTTVFPDTQSARYWTGVEMRPSISADAEIFKAYFVDFKKGKEGTFGAHKKYLSKCVREIKPE